MTNASRLFHAAIRTAIDTRFSDPATMQAVDKLASGFRDIDGLLHYLWNCNDGFGINGDFVGKSDAIEIVTGKPFAYWASLHDGGRWPSGPRGKKFTGFWQNGIYAAY